jgi:putative addiction module component (TIGR02574 family)
MSPSLSELLKLPAAERAEPAMALWESLSEAEREGELELTPEEAAELHRRWTEHVQRPESSIPWDAGERGAGSGADDLSTRLIVADPDHF